MTTERVLGEPSRFWERLGQQHAQDLDEFGFELFKRHQALRYFTWRWRWGDIMRSEQMRFLLSHSSPATWLSCAREPADLTDRSWAGLDWSRRERWLYVFAVRLLWEYSRGRDRLNVVGLPEPELGQPLPVFRRGRLISQDLANSALEVGAMYRALGGDEPRSIVEIGAGYGRTAYVLLRLFPEASYTIVDIPPAVTLSRWYLTRLFPERQLRFLLPQEAGQIEPGSMDLALSVSSLQEMTRQQIEGYISLIDRVASGGVVYLKQWATWQNPDDDLALNFDHYPIPTQWRQRYRERAPVQTRFTQAAWSIPGGVN
jgi:putative sugar O-methyltransferase